VALPLQTRNPWRCYYSEIFVDTNPRTGITTPSGVDALLTGVMFMCKMTPMVKTQVYLGPEELDALHQVAARSDRSVADLIREAIRRVWLRPTREGPVGLWNGEPKRTSVDHDSIYDHP
jgi:hypothetical protein